MTTLITAVAALSAVLVVGASCPNGSTPHGVDNVAVEFKGMNTTTDSLLENSLAEVILNLRNQSLGCCPFGYTCYYTFGSRVPGDYIVGHADTRRSVIFPQDITVDVFYPESGCGKMISYVEIKTRQSLRSGDAYIAGGGIGQRFITVRVVARLTFFIDLVAAIYGY
ncbi:unnamed protein product [Hermetia illucens]|uniref:Uncharacterized protein n=1 Tax=Hermetia illucens TaxID=343691 RepID=A0A7R8V0W2_HERIL|nr:uncharacterized protein LOC119657641 [Hermetia illucens]CAD7090553.1 unnamed protein product [Hermetia illucens]